MASAKTRTCGEGCRSPDGVFWRQEMQSGVPTAFFGVRKCDPESRRHFLASGNAIRGPDGIFWRQEMQSGVATAFPAYPKDKKMSMGKGFSKNKIHSLCVPRYTPLLLSTDLAAGETIGLTNAVHICEQTGGRTHITQGCFFFMEKVLRVNQFFRQKMKSEKNNGNHHSTVRPS